MENDKILKIGILGAGPIAQFAHFEACRKARNAELYAICDVAEDLRERMVAIHRPQKVFHDYEKMLEDPALDAVIIAVADSFHVSAATRAIEAGKHVLVEKPVGISVDELESIREMLSQSGVIFQVGHMKRFDPGLVAAKNFIAQEMGEMLAMKAWYCDSTHRYSMTDAVQPIPIVSDQSIKPSLDPKTDKQKYYMLAHGSHLVDTARYLAGPIESLRARFLEKFGAYCWFIDVNFENGGMGHLDLTVAVRMDWHEGFQIYGEHGSVVGKTFNPWYFKSSEVECFYEKDQTYKRVLGADAHFYRLQVEGFADTILENAPQQGANFNDGMASIKAMLAIAQSVSSGETVYLKNL
ncbi:MAG: oxidoreductase [Anaerolineaceae bacterium]|nr:oxidoreductase [Anaerolineaceae bacterium]